MKSNNYNFIAPIYNLLTKLVFLGSIQKSQFALLNLLPNEGEILFIGGGSGDALNKLVQLKPKLYIHYIDKSKKMISLSKKKTPRSLHKNINFIVGSEKNLPNQNYDGIISFYFLDLFRSNDIKRVFTLLNQRLNQNGIWLVADFNPPQNTFQQLISSCMFLFLKWTTTIENKKIKDLQPLFIPSEYHLIKNQEFYGKFIFSNAYVKR